MTKNKQNDTIELTSEQLQAIQRTLESGNRVELIPIKNSVKIVKVKRELIK